MKLDSAIFYTNNLEKVISFYKDIVGLNIEYIQENKFASFQFENGRLGIKQAKEEREVPGNQTVFIEIEDIEKTYDEFKKRGIIFLKELTKENWAINFSFLDSDGNKVQFIKRE